MQLFPLQFPQLPSTICPSLCPLLLLQQEPIKTAVPLHGTMTLPVVLNSNTLTSALSEKVVVMTMLLLMVPRAKPSLLLTQCQLCRLLQILHALVLVAFHWLLWPRQQPLTQQLQPTFWKLVWGPKHCQYLPMCTISSRSRSQTPWFVQCVGKLFESIHTTS